MLAIRCCDQFGAQAVDKYGESVDFKDKLSRAKFEELNKDLFKKCAAPIKTVLDDTDTRPSEVDSIVLVR